MTASAPERLRPMLLATWYPSADNPIDGVFVLTVRVGFPPLPNRELLRGRA